MMEERKLVSPNKLLIRLKNETNKHPISAAAIIFYWSANTVARRVLCFINKNYPIARQTDLLKKISLGN
jgi:hypothetical protein